MLTFSFPTRYRLHAAHFEKPRRILTFRQRHLVRAAEDEEELEIPISQNTEKPQGETVAEKLEKYRQDFRQIAEAEARADAVAQNRLNQDYYSQNWEGDVYVGSGWNILTVILFISVAVPIAGLIFAYFTYGTLWGIDSQAI